jgi:hypothetical protein
MEVILAAANMDGATCAFEVTSNMSALHPASVEEWLHFMEASLKRAVPEDYDLPMTFSVFVGAALVALLALAFTCCVCCLCCGCCCCESQGSANSQAFQVLNDIKLKRMKQDIDISLLKMRIETVEMISGLSKNVGMLMERALNDEVKLSGLDHNADDLLSSSSSSSESDDEDLGIYSGKRPTTKIGYFWDKETQSHRPLADMLLPLQDKITSLGVAMESTFQSTAETTKRAEALLDERRAAQSEHPKDSADAEHVSACETAE